MKRFTKNKRMLLAACMLATVANQGFAQTVWDFTDASVWGDKTLTSGSYDVKGETIESNGVTFNFENDAVTYENGIKVTSNGSTSKNHIKTALNGKSFSSVLIKIDGENAKANLDYIYGKRTTTCSQTGKYICISTPNNNKNATSGCYTYASNLAESNSLTIEKIVCNTNENEASVEIGAQGIATFYPTSVVKFSDDATNVKVYIIKEVNNGVAKLEEIDATQNLAGLQGYIIKGKVGTYKLSIQRGAAELTEGNMLKGSAAATQVNSDESTNRYFLASDAQGNVSFKKVTNDTESAARKAWLEIPAAVAQNATVFSIKFPGGGTTGINQATTKDNTKKDNLYYDLNGVAKKTPSKGINIINGKKVIFK